VLEALLEALVSSTMKINFGESVGYSEIVARVENLVTLKTELCLRCWLEAPDGRRITDDLYSIMELD
jgi:hypothetical protein